MTEAPQERIADLLRAAGARGWVHATRVGADPRPTGAADLSGAGARHTDGAEIALGADVCVPMASLYKLVLAIAWGRAVDAGEVDPHARIAVPASGRTSGPTGLSLLLDEVVLSERDLVLLMLTLSDNAAADTLLDRLGLEPLRAVLEEAGLTATTLHGGTRHHQRLLLEELGAPGFPEALRLLQDRPGQEPTAVYDPALSSTTTARDMTRLLGVLWRDELLEPQTGRFLRAAMVRQAFRHRLATGFPHDDVVVASRTGTLLALRHEVGVVAYPGEEPVAVAVLTHAANPAQHLPAIDQVIGTVGFLAVGALRQVAYP